MTDYKKVTRKSRDPKAETTGVRLRKGGHRFPSKAQRVENAEFKRNLLSASDQKIFDENLAGRKLSNLTKKELTDFERKNIDLMFDKKKLVEHIDKEEKTKGFVSSTDEIIRKEALKDLQNKTRKQIGIVTGGLASGTKAVAGSAFKGSGSVAKRGFISAGASAIGTPAKEGLGKRILVGTGKGIGKGISIGAKGAGRRIKESAVNRLKNSIRGKR